MNNLRLKKIQTGLKRPLLIKKKENLFYLTGRSLNLSAEEYLLLRPAGAEPVAFGGGLEKITWVKKVDRLKNIGKYLKGKNLDLEWGFTYGEGEYLKLKIKNSKFKISPTRSLVDVFRQVKEPSELALIGKSMKIVERVFIQVKKKLKGTDVNGKYTERSLADFITKTGLRMGAEDVSFPAIVASGANAAIPHHLPSSKRLKKGESIIIDFGFKYKNYCSDFTRTVFLKTVPKKLEVAYNQTEKAYLVSLDFAKVGIHSGKVYDKAVQVLKEKHLDKFFIHSLGHGTGLEIHELPNLSPGSKDILANNMVFSIEPGVYLPNVGGIRIEDLVYLKNEKVEKFIQVSTKLEDNIL